MDHLNMSKDERAYHDAMHAFYNRAEVQELGKQLSDGLIHPIDYAAQIILLAEQGGLWGE